MADANLSAARLRELLHYEPETGVFTRRVTARRWLAGERVGCQHAEGYRQLTIDGTKFLEHRTAWLYVHGEWPRGDIDHIDGNRSNNALTNLRDVTRSVNLQNRKRATSHSISGMIGVHTSVRSGRRTSFYSRIKTDGATISLGHFASPEEAQAAYLTAKRRLHEGNTL